MQACGQLGERVNQRLRQSGNTYIRGTAKRSNKSKGRAKRVLLIYC
jgi:hypothetical protein